MKTLKVARTVKPQTQPKNDVAQESAVSENPFLSTDLPLTPGNILLWQKTIGNQAVQRLILNKTLPQKWSREGELARLKTHKMLQRYTQEGNAKINPSWRTSVNSKIIQVDDHEVYATADTIKTANESLKNSNSYVKLEGVTKAPWGGELEHYQRVKLTFNAEGSMDQDYKLVNGLLAKSPEERHKYLVETSDKYRDNLEQIIAEFGTGKDEAKAKAQKEEALAKQKKELDVLLKLTNVHESDLFVTPRDCEKTAGMVMGANRKGTDPYLVIKSLETSEPEKVKMNGRYKDRDTSTAAKAQNNFLVQALPKFLEWLQKKDKAKDYVALVKKLEEFGKPTPETYNYATAMSAYELIQSSDLASTFNEMFGINEFLKPEVGQALTLVNDEREKRKADGDIHSPKELWNFHWAGVVLTDAQDYLTLQALADQDQNRITITWYFKMYGSGEQSFHSEEKKDPHTGTRPMSLAVGYQKAGK